jgi:hypothetical protein
MSELKATTVYDAYWKANSTVEGTCILVYLKSEADKVIAELKEKFKNSRNSHKYWMKEYLIEYEETRHNKYKRCLAMARWCHNQREIYERDSYNWELEPAAVDSLRNKANIMRKWRKRWLELAEKFKEAK